MTTPRFTRNVENFSCRHCGNEVIGDGYTNHCPKCLWSLHVDENPGDRAATCKGEMAPVGWSKKHGEVIIHHQCQSCRELKRNKMATEDNMDAVFTLTPII